MISSRRTQKGFLLTEALITMLLISIVLIALARFQVIALQDNDLANSRTFAINLAQNKIETMRGFIDHTTFHAITDGAESVGPPGSGADLILQGLNTVYTCLWSVTGDTDGNEIQLEVSVSWPYRQDDKRPGAMIMLRSTIRSKSAVRAGLLF